MKRGQLRSQPGSDPSSHLLWKAGPPHLTAPSPPTGALGASGLVGLESCQSWKGPRRPPHPAPSGAVWGNSLGQVPGPDPGPALPQPQPHHPLAGTSPRLIRAPSLCEHARHKPRACPQAFSFADTFTPSVACPFFPVARLASNDRAAARRPSASEGGRRPETEGMVRGGQCSPPSRATVPSDAPRTFRGDVRTQNQTAERGPRAQSWNPGPRA